MSYLNEPLTLAQQRELLENEGMVLKRDIVFGVTGDGEDESITVEQSEDDSPIKPREILWKDEFDEVGVAYPFNIQTLANFLKWKTEKERAYGERSKESDIRSAIKVLSNLGISSIK